MKEMKYKPQHETEILHTGEFLGYTFFILSLGTHPTAYVKLTPKNKLFGRNYMNYDGDEDIFVHGGITYATDHLCISVNNKIKTLDGWWIGWDYAHAGDYTALFDVVEKYHFPNKKWKTEEIFEDVKSVCEQLKKMEV